MADAELLWRWANDRETRRNSFSKAAIPYPDHVAWLERRLASDSARTWIFSDGEMPVGQVRFDIAGATAEIGIAVAPEQRGRGYAKAMLRHAVRRLCEELGDGVRPRASVLADNRASLGLFRACGFQEVAAVERDGEPVIVLELKGMVS